MKKVDSTRRPDETSCDPGRQTVRSGADEAGSGREESKPKKSDYCPESEVRVELQGSELWKRFYEIGTEMIITKAGRYNIIISRGRFYSRRLAMLQTGLKVVCWLFFYPAKPANSKRI